MAIDSNRFIAALLRDASTRKLLISKSFEFFAPAELKLEFETHRGDLLQKSELKDSTFTFIANFLLQKVTLVRLDDYPEAERRAREVMQEIDPKDAPFLAVAIALNLAGIWSEDRHFQKQSILPVYSNKRLYEFYRSAPD